MAEQMNIYQKLARIRKQVEVIQKNKSGYGYKYVSEDEILAKKVPALDVIISAHTHTKLDEPIVH